MCIYSNKIIILYGIKITRNLILLGSRVITSIFRTVHNSEADPGGGGGGGGGN